MVTSKRSKKLAIQILLKMVLIILIISPLTVFFSIYLTTYLNLFIPDTGWVSWYDDPQHKVYIGWETEESVIGSISYGEDPENLISTKTELANAKFHIVNISGLSPDTKYYYEIKNDGSDYTSGSFRTAPDTMKEFTFGLSADTQQKVGPGWHYKTAEILDQKNYSFFAMVGDYVEDGSKEEWNHFFHDASTYLDTTPFIPVIGNHDRKRVGTYYFQEYFAQTVDKVKDTNIYDDNYQFYYSFNWSSVHFQILHFPEIDIDDEGEPDGVNPRDYNQSFTVDQMNWIEEDLERAKDLPFRISLFHCPITGAGFYGENHILIDELLPILLEYNVTATIHGHAHHYERGHFENPYHPGNDLQYFVVGCGGGLVDVGLHPIEETDIAFASPCYTEGSATADTLTFTTFMFDGSVADKIVIEKEGI